MKHITSTFICSYKGFSIRRSESLYYFIEFSPMRFSTLELAKSHIDSIFEKNSGDTIIHK